MTLGSEEAEQRQVLVAKGTYAVASAFKVVEKPNEINSLITLLVSIRVKFGFSAAIPTRPLSTIKHLDGLCVHPP